MIDSPGAIFYLYKVKSSNHNRLLLSFSERAGIRTPDNLIKSQVLYHLSYTPLTGVAGLEPAVQESESCALPLGDTPICILILKQVFTLQSFVE